MSGGDHLLRAESFTSPWPTGSPAGLRCAAGSDVMSGVGPDARNSLRVRGMARPPSRHPSIRDMKKREREKRELRKQRRNDRASFSFSGPTFVPVLFSSHLFPRISRSINTDDMLGLSHHLTPSASPPTLHHHHLLLVLLSLSNSN